jgi:hypothetical protein
MAGRPRTSKHQQWLDRVAEERAGLAEREAALAALETQFYALEAQFYAREAAQAERRRKESDILMAAAARDNKAEARDAEADRRDREADLRAFLHDQAYSVDYIQARRFAALDRLESKSDRKSAAEDRSQLTADDVKELFDDRSAD